MMLYFSFLFFKLAVVHILLLYLLFLDHLNCRNFQSKNSYSIVQSCLSKSYTKIMATKVSTRKINLPITLENVQFELEKELKTLSSFLDTVTASIKASMIADFEIIGGCQKCRGRGWVVTWDTLDYIDGSAAEFSPCPVTSCTEATRTASGLHPTYNLKYDKIRGVQNPLASSDAYRCIAGPIVTQLDDIHFAVQDLKYQRHNFIKGDRVVVSRGRKVPLGTAGRVAWVSANTGGVLVKNEDVWLDHSASGTWVNPRNLEKLAE